MLDFCFPALNLGVGSYSVSAALHAGDQHTLANFDWWDRALVFQVLRGDQPASIGVCVLPVEAVWRAADDGTAGAKPADENGRFGRTLSAADVTRLRA